MTTFREFIGTSIENPDPRRRKFARLNVGLGAIASSTGGFAAAQITDGSIVAILLTIPICAALAVGANYLVFRRGEPTAS